jgi:aspartate aminotransferase
MTDLGHNKLNLGLSGFRQDDGSIFVPPTTRSIERSMHMRGGLSHDALPIEGHAPFLELGLKFAYGKDGHAFKEPSEHILIRGPVHRLPPSRQCP